MSKRFGGLLVSYKFHIRHYLICPSLFKKRGRKILHSCLFYSGLHNLGERVSDKIQIDSEDSRHINSFDPAKELFYEEYSFYYFIIYDSNIII